MSRRSDFSFTRIISQYISHYARPSSSTAALSKVSPSTILDDFGYGKLVLLDETGRSELARWPILFVFNRLNQFVPTGRELSYTLLQQRDARLDWSGIFFKIAKPSGARWKVADSETQRSTTVPHKPPVATAEKKIRDDNHGQGEDAEDELVKQC